MSQTILFFGNEKLATGVNAKAEILNSLIKAGYDIGAVIISQKLDKNPNNLEIVNLALANNITVKSYPSLKQSLDEIAGFGANAAVLAAYGKIVPKEVLDLFKVGIINVHPSLLPKHRGPTPIESAILAGDQETGVSIMRLAAEMDTGPIYAQRSIKLDGNETKQELADTLDELGAETLINCLNDILNGKLIAKDQPKDGATYDERITKEDGIIDWRQSWNSIDRMIRAYSVWPKTKTTLGGLDITLLKAHFENKSGEPGQSINFEGRLGSYCQDGLVVIDELIPAGSKPMSGHDFILGYGKQVFS